MRDSIQFAEDSACGRLCLDHPNSALKLHQHSGCKVQLRHSPSLYPIKGPVRHRFLRDEKNHDFHRAAIIQEATAQYCVPAV